ncbi:MAG: NAD(P)H-dependent oxidoreductase [Xanthomonadales bacterium]|nr:hypothetical protein [Xanthomonadales bacterium]MCC6592943.1 NAD(P)H-dependent oxidoreductase [Xanthomonadales bacterium]MCE7930152.1 flavodoxin family protein [Xanthomonadales bacterium PRO6]
MRRICLIQGHPSRDNHFCHALAQAYMDGARTAGHDVREIRVAELDFPLLRERADWEGAPPPAIAAAQRDFDWAEHLVIVYPLWLGALPALLKAFFEQLLRPGFAFQGKVGEATHLPLRGRSARTIVTMGMPGIVYRLWYRAHTLRAFERNVLRFVGIKPCRHSVVGQVEGLSELARAEWLGHLRSLGARAR